MSSPQQLCSGLNSQSSVASTIDHMFILSSLSTPRTSTGAVPVSQGTSVTTCLTVPASLQVHACMPTPPQSSLPCLPRTQLCPTAFQPWAITTPQQSPQVSLRRNTSRLRALLPPCGLSVLPAPRSSVSPPSHLAPPHPSPGILWDSALLSEGMLSPLEVSRACSPLACTFCPASKTLFVSSSPSPGLPTFLQPLPLPRQMLPAATCRASCPSRSCLCSHSHQGPQVPVGELL